MAKSYMPVDRISLQIRRLRLAKALVEGKSYRDACLFAGYRAKSAQRDSVKIIRKAMPTIREVMEAAGLTDSYIMEKWRELLDAKQFRPVVVRKGKEDEIVTWEAPDPRVQTKALETVSEMKGHRRWGLPNAAAATQNNVQVNIFFGERADGKGPARAALSASGRNGERDADIPYEPMDVTPKPEETE